MIEIRASFSRMFQLFAIFALLAALAGIATVLSWNNVQASGLLLLALIAALFVLVFVTYRMLARPVMFRLNEEGMFIKRLGMLVPWYALDRIERFEYEGNKLFSLIETEEGDEVFTDKRILTGARMNSKIGLPPLVISMDGMQTTSDELAEILSNSSKAIKFVDRAPH